MDNNKLEQFLNELTTLSHKHGLGIQDTELYELEAEDADRRYTCNEESVISFE